jgi:hypothetical protein
MAKYTAELNGFIGVWWTVGSGGTIAVVKFIFHRCCDVEYVSIQRFWSPRNSL